MAILRIHVMFFFSTGFDTNHLSPSPKCRTRGKSIKQNERRSSGALETHVNDNPPSSTSIENEAVTHGQKFDLGNAEAPSVDNQEEEDRSVYILIVSI